MSFVLMLLAVVAAGEQPAEQQRYEVVTFMATGCPLAKLYAGRVSELAARYPQVHFRGVSTNAHDSDAEVTAFGKTHNLRFEKDPAAILRLGATRSPEVFLLVDGEVVYQGRIDDQYTPGTNRSRPTRHDLEEAIQEALALQPVRVAKTTATGCRITYPTQSQSSGPLTFDQVAPIIHQHCSGCHRPGEVAPFSLLTYRDVQGWQKMIREVVSSNRMPPWHADPRHGEFSNNRSLSAAEKDLLIRWLDAGAPAGNQKPVTPTFKDGWKIKTDLILQMQEPFMVPATGVIEYQEFILDPGLTEDTWVQAIQIRPGNRAVVHHINVYLRPKNVDVAKMTHYSSMPETWTAVMVPGIEPTSWPIGIAKVIPASFQVVLSVHYQPNGTPQTDRSSIAFQFADPATVRQQVATRVQEKADLIIAPHDVTTVTQDWSLEEDYTLHSLFPHMHLRGKSFRIEIVGGPILLDVPQYDFNWQHRYVLAEPLQLSAGTVIRCTAAFDNTASNPNNPNPNAIVRHGLQSTDEMFQGGFEITRTREDRHYKPIQRQPPTLFAALACVSLFFLSRRRAP
jgi:hypothetical protein